MASDTLRPAGKTQEDPAGQSSAGEQQRTRGSVRGVLTNAALFTAATLLVFLLAEGFSSAFLVLYENATRRDEDVIYNQHDSLLGWVNIPSLHVPDLWGAGVGLQNNAQGFRASREITPEVSPGRIRILCSGDSFAFGQGVADDGTWCHQLQRLDERFETVNLGLPGYGIDQAYLRYKRDGVGLEHQIHLFTFIGADIARMRWPDHHGYAKPILRFHGDSVVLENTPVPQLLPTLKRLSTKYSSGLRSIELAGRAVSRILPSSGSGGRSDAWLAPLVSWVFSEVHRLGEENGAIAILVYLPALNDLEGDYRWRGPVSAIVDSLGHPLIDLTPDLRALPAGEAAGFWIPLESDAGGHYNAAGHAWVAQKIYERMLDLPSAAALLTGLPARQRATSN
jgi:hypothetical protein